MGAFVVGLVLGAAAGGGEPEPASTQTVLATVSVTRDPTEAERAALDARSAELDQRQAEIDARSTELDTRSAGLDAREAAIGQAEAAFEAGTIPGDGIYLVGTDFQPGTYRTTEAADCYWARLSGTGGTFDEILANGIVNGQGVVTIRSSDVAFETTRCGSWHLVP